MSSTPVKELEIRRYEDAVVIAEIRTARLLDPAQIESLFNELRAAVEIERVPMVLLNFESVRALSSTAVNAVIQLANEIRDRDGQIRLCGLLPDIAQVFTLLNLNKYLRSFETVQKALASFDR